MTTARQYGYTYQEADISLGHVAARFHTTVKTIWVSTASRDGKFRNVSEAEFLTTVQTGDRIFVPYEGDAWEWRSIAPKATTLKELCSKKPEPARVGGPSLTSELLWFHIVNEAFRGRCLARVSGLDAKRNLDQDPGSVTIQPSDTLFVPYPMRNKAPRVSAAPNGKGKSAVVVSAPEWISDLRAFDQKVNDLAAQISANSAQCDKLQRDGQAVCYRLAALARLVSFQISRANDKQKGRLQALQAALAKLQSASADLLFANPAEKLQVPQDATRKNLGEKLLLVLHDDKLKALVEKVRKNPQERVHGDSVSLIADRLFERGYRAAGWTQLAEKAKRDTDAAFALLTSSGGAAVDSSTPLSTYISLAGATGGMGTSSLGNLPGPSSLSVALVEWWVLYKLPDAMGPAAKVAELRAAGYRAIAANKPDDLVEICKTLRLSAKNEAAHAREAFIRAAGLSKQEIDDLDRVLKYGLKDKARELAQTVAGRTQATAGWSAVLVVLNGLALLGTVASDDDVAARKWISIFGGSVSTALGALQTLAALADSKALGAALGKVGPFFGAASAATGILTSAYTALTEQEPASIIASAVQLVGGALSVGGFMLGVPGLQLGGTVILLGSATYAGWVALQQLMAPGTKRVMLAHLGFIQQQDVYKRIVKVYPYLATDMKNVVDLISADDAAGLFEMIPTPDTVAFLRATGFRDEDVERIATKAADYHRYEL